MKPILKWTGGKSSELKIIKENLPKKINRFIEPFLGGGALYFDLENNISIVNDFNKELITFYNNISKTNEYLKIKNILQKEQSYKLNCNNLAMNNDFDINAKNILNDVIYQKYLNKELINKKKLIEKRKKRFFFER